MVKEEVIDPTRSASTSSPRSSKSKRASKMKTSASSQKTQFNNEKCAQCSKPLKPNLNDNTKDLRDQTSGIHGALPDQADAAEHTVARPNTSLLQQGLNLLEPLVPKESLQTGHSACNMPPPQIESYPLNFNRQLSAPCLHKNSAPSAASSYSNYLVNKNISRPLTLKLFPDANVDNNTSVFKGLDKERRVNDSGDSTVVSNAEEVDLELRLWFPINN